MAGAPAKFSPICTGVFKRGGDPCAAGVVVVARGFLDPIQAFVVQGLAALDRLGDRQALVVVGHQRDTVRQAAADGAHHGQIVLPPSAVPGAA